MKHFLAGIISALLVQQHCTVLAQLQSCTDLGVHLNGPSCMCEIKDSWLDEIGVSNFTTELSVEPLAWMVGHIPHDSTGNNTILPDHQVFYLQQPPSIDLRRNSSVEACAIFFNGIAPKLKFNYTESEAQASVSRGTCEDALTIQCVTDWTKQAHQIVDNTDDSLFSCQMLADTLQASPPSSCRIVKKNWGEVVAKSLSAKALPHPLNRTEICHNVTYQNYSLTEVLRINGTEDEMYHAITPIFTILKPNSVSEGLESEVNLKCLKPVSDVTASNTAGLESGSAGLQLHMPIFLWAIGCMMLQLLA